MNKRFAERDIVIFDFDGTIADTVFLGLDISNEIAAFFNIKQISRERFNELRYKSAREIIKEYKIPVYRLMKISKMFRITFETKKDEVKPIEGIIPILEKMHKTFKLGIVSSNSEITIEYVLKKYDILHLFDFIHAGKSLFGKCKVMKDIAKKYKLDTKKFIYIGDETRDIEAMKKCNIPIIAVTWGFNPKPTLIRFNPDAIADNPDDLLKLLNV